MPGRPSRWVAKHQGCQAAVDAVRADLTAEIVTANEPIPSTYACQACGRRDGLDAVVPDEVWEQIRDGLNLLCLWCIDRRCREAGIQTSASLHFVGLAITGTSQSDADQEHVSRLTAEIERLRAEHLPVRASLAQIAGAFTSGVYCSNCGDPVDDCDCIIGTARRVLAGRPLESRK